MLLASRAPACDLKRRMADRYPVSSDFSAGRTSASMNSFDHTTINPQGVLGGVRWEPPDDHGAWASRERIADGGDCVVFETPSLVKAFIEAMERGLVGLLRITGLAEHLARGNEGGAFIAYFGERDVGGRVDRSRTGGRSAVMGETTLAPDWLRAARMPSRHAWGRGSAPRFRGLGSRERRARSLRKAGVKLRELVVVVAYVWRSGEPQQRERRDRDGSIATGSRL